MPIITKLQAGKRDPTRVNLFLDGKFAFSLSADEVISQALKKGQELSEKFLTSLSSLSQEEKLFQKILNFLSYRPRSRREVELRLAKYLLNHEHRQTLIDSTLERLEALGYLDDLAFANWFVDSRTDNRPRSLRHLRSELMSKGLSRQVIDQALANYDELTALKLLLTKKSTSSKDKLRIFLARRGFPFDLIKKVLDDF